MAMEDQVMILWVATNGHLDDIPMDRIKAFEEGFYPFMAKNFPDVAHKIKNEGKLSDDISDSLKKAIG